MKNHFSLGLLGLGAELFIASIFPVLAAAAAETPPVAEPVLAIAWNDLKGDSGHIDYMTIVAPWTLSGHPLETGRHTVLRAVGRRVYAVCPGLDAVKTITLDPWEIERTYQLPRGTEPMDIAVVDARTAFITGRRATHLMRLNLDTGLTEPVIDFQPFADIDGIPDLGAMAFHEGRLFVQVRRLNEEDFRGSVPPAYLAVVDVAGPTLVDVDPALPGIQAIALAGAYPKRPMQWHQGMRRLFLSSSGGFFDEGGIEMIDLRAMRSMGLVVHESDGLTGADIGPFYIMDPDRGYLVFTTDLTISSHLTGFSLLSGVSDVNLHTEVDFLASVLAYHPETDRLFFPSSGFVNPGIHVFDGTTGQRLTTNVVPTDGRPTDMVLVVDDPVPPGPAELQIDLHPCVEISGSIGANYQVQYSLELPATNWMKLTNVVLRESPTLWCDPTAVSGQPQKYYRAVVDP